MRYSNTLRALALLFALAFPAHAQVITPVQMRNANLTTSSTQNFVTTLGAFTAPRTLTIPGRGALSAYYLQFVDTANAISASNTLTIVMADGGLINGGASLVITFPGVYLFIVPNSTGVAANVIFPPGASTVAGGTPGQIQYNAAGILGGFTTSGDATINTASGVLTLATVNANVGTFGSATTCITTTQNAKGLTTAISAATCTPALGSITGFGTGVAAALALNIGSAGAPVLFNGAGGTPSSMVGTNITGTAAGLTAGTASTVAVGGITGLSANCGTWLATASSANLRSCMTDESGTGVLYFQGGDAGTPSALVGTNISGTAAGLTAGTFTAGSASNLTSGTLNSGRLAWNSAILQATPSAPTGTTSVTAVMMGLGVTTCRFTPTFSTRARFEINGSVANTGINGISTFSLRYGTGAGPANGAAASGTSPSSSQSVTSSTANAQVAFIVTGLVTGLTAGTTYWFDTTLAVSAGTSAILSPNCAANEL